MGAKRVLPAVGEGAYTGGSVIGSGSGSSGGSSGDSGSSVIGALTSGFDVLTDPHTYYRIGQVLAGAILLIVGTLMLFRKQAVAGAQIAAMAAV
jgi:hypothetical protein